MKLLHHLVPCIMMALLCIQLPAQIDVSVYPSKPVFDTLRYEKVDKNSKPAKLSCKDGGYGLYQLQVSEKDFTELDNKWDTLKTNKEEWTAEDMKDFDKKYNEEHQQELKEHQEQDIEGYRDIQQVCEEKILDLIQNNWATDDYCLCVPNCKSITESCYITKGEVIQMRNTKAEYRYETLSASKLTDEGPPNEFEILLRIIKIYEATVYFKVSCFCSDNNVMAQTVPSGEGGEYTSSTAAVPVVTRTNLSAALPLEKIILQKDIVSQDTRAAADVPWTKQANVSATGTGRTTGHIADLKIKNTEDTPISILSQTVFIPSGGRYQPYVAEIPGTTIPPKTTVVIPVTGYCADVHKPPVASGDGMPPIDTWITTTPVPTPKPSGTDYPVVTNVVHPFTPQNIPEIVTTPGFTPVPPPKTIPVPPGITPTWPGTDIPVNGTIDPVEYPETFAPVIIDALKKITVAFDKLKGEGTVYTPFGGDPVKERESVIQQTFWIFTADITGDKYQKENFQEKVIEQFETSTGTTVATLPEPEKKKLEGGVDAFWNVFVATGVEAKVISEKTPSTTTTPERPTVPSTEVPPELVRDGACTLTEEIKDTKPMLDYAIANTGTKGKNEEVKEAFKKAIEEAAGLVSDSKGSDTIDVGFSTPQMPASAWSLYFPHVVAGQANATAFALDPKNPLKSAWTTEPLQTKAEGNREVVLTHVMDAECKSTLVGINFAKVRASSGLKASLGNIEALRVINFVGEVAIDIAIQKGKGTFKKLGEYLKDKTKEMAKDEAKEFIKEEMKRLGNEWKDKSDEEAEKSMDELLKDIKTGGGGEEEQTGEEFLNDWLAEMLVEGEGFDPAEKIEGDLLDKVDSPIDWSPVKTNTYAIGEGSLDVYVDADHGVAKAASGVRYKREGLEDAKDAEKGGGVICDAGMASHTTSGTITLKTLGKTGSWAGATGEGIISTGHGIAIATLESFNGMYVIAICECPDETSYETFYSVTAYSVETNMTGIWVSMFERMMNDVKDQLDKDIANSGNASKSLPLGTAEKVQKGLEDAAKQAAQSILPCGGQK